MIQLTYIWPDDKTSSAWIDVDRISYIVMLPSTQGTMIALDCGDKLQVAEHPHDIIRMVASFADMDDDGTRN